MLNFKFFEELPEFLIYLYQNSLALRVLVLFLIVLIIVLNIQKYYLKMKKSNYPNDKVILHQFPRGNSGT